MVDTFVPNDACIVGGDYIPSSSDGKKSENELSDEIGMGMGMGGDGDKGRREKKKRGPRP